MRPLRTFRALVYGGIILHPSSLVLAHPLSGVELANGLATTLKEVPNSRSQLADGVRAVLDKYYDRPPNTRDDSPWRQTLTLVDCLRH
jgi:hypothetical protein